MSQELTKKPMLAHVTKELDEVNISGVFVMVYLTLFSNVLNQIVNTKMFIADKAYWVMGYQWGLTIVMVLFAFCLKRTNRNTLVLILLIDIRNMLPLCDHYMKSKMENTMQEYQLFQNQTLLSLVCLYCVATIDLPEKVKFLVVAFIQLFLVAVIIAFPSTEELKPI